MARVFPVILIAALLIYALADCIMTPRDRVPRGLPKGLWIVLILVPVIGPVAWLALSRLSGTAPYQCGATPSPAPAAPPKNFFARKPKPVAPDDDETFLADLDWKARKAHYDRQRREAENRDSERPRDESNGDSDRS